MLNNIWLPGLLLLVAVGAYIWAAVRLTGQGRLHLKNPHNGKLREAPIGFSWTTFFFGPLPALFRGHWWGAFAIFVLAVVTSGLASLVFAFYYNKWYVSFLIKEGFKVTGADRDVDEISKSLSRELPVIEAETTSESI
jgi:hypothetical protein